MTYIPVNRILVHIPNKFEAIKVAALECRRLNERLQAMEDVDDLEEKITTLAVKRLMEGGVQYHDARERREQERSEAMLAAAEEMLDMTAPTPATLLELGGVVEEEVVVGTPAAAAVVTKVVEPVEKKKEIEVEVEADDADEDEDMAMEAEALEEEVVEEIAEESKD